MDFVVRTHEVVYSLQDLSTFRNGGFVRTKMNKGKVGSSLRMRDASCRQVTAVSSSLETPAYTSNKQFRAGNGQISSNQVSKSSYFDGGSRLWKLVVKEGQLDEALSCLENMIVSNETPDIMASIRLIEKLCGAGRIRKAARVLDLLERSEEATLDIRAYTAFVKGLCYAGEVDNALKLLRRLHSEQGSCNPDSYLYNIVINAVFGKGRFEQGMKLLDEMRSKGIEPDSITCSIVVNGMCKQGRLDEAIKLISSHGWTPCVESYNNIVDALCNADRYADAEKLLVDMRGREGCSPTVFTFRILIKYLCFKGSSYRAISLLESMPQYGCNPDLFHYNQIIHCLCKERKTEMVIECIEVMISKGCYPNIVVFNTLLAALCKYGKGDAAVEFFNELRSSRSCAATVATYNIMIDGLSRLKRASQAIKLLDEVRGNKDFKPDPVTYAVLIVGLVSERDIQSAIKILDELKGSGVAVPSKCYGWIIKELCDVGRVDRAVDLLVYVVSKGSWPTQASYAAVVEGLASIGLAKEGQELLKELSSRGALDKSWINGLATKIEKMSLSS
ncbi:Pentatricopeptide repeat-containing protein At1g09900 [Linum grandiflorum]